MKDQLLALIKETELARAQAIVDGQDRIAMLLRDALINLYWAYKELVDYE